MPGQDDGGDSEIQGTPGNAQWSSFLEAIRKSVSVDSEEKIDVLKVMLTVLAKHGNSHATLQN